MPSESADRPRGRRTDSISRIRRARAARVSRDGEVIVFTVQLDIYICTLTDANKNLLKTRTDLRLTSPDSRQAGCSEWRIFAGAGGDARLRSRRDRPRGPFHASFVLRV